MNQRKGKASVKPAQPVYILNSASIVGTKEGEGPLGLLFDKVGEDDLFGCATWEEAESKLQKEAVGLALYLQEICWDSPWLPLSASRRIRYRFWVCTEPVLPVGSR